MPYCPECGGEMRYTPATKYYTCKSCGLSVTYQELIELKEKLKPVEEPEEERERRRREYLKWWFSKKK